MVLKSDIKTDAAEDAPAERRAQRSIISWLPAFAFIVLITALATYVGVTNSARINTLKQRQAANAELGLPSDYPIEFVPIHADIEILDTERGTSESTLGEKMDKWFVHGQFTIDRKGLSDYYSNLMVERGLRQTHSLSLPASDGSGANYGFEYANETYIANFVIEKKSSDEISQFELTLHRVVE